MKALNDEKATHLIYDTSDPTIKETFPIPFQNVIDDFTSIPDDIENTLQDIPSVPLETGELFSEAYPEDYKAGSILDARLEFTDEYMLNFGVNEEVNKALFARKLVKYLENRGVTDKRTIAGIVAHGVGLPQFGGIGFGDKEKIAGLTTEIVRFPLEAGMYIFG